MLALQEVSVFFGERTLFKDVSLLIGPHDRIGLVGSNGSGKTTLLRTIAGLHLPDGGRIEKAAYVGVGYLPQEGIAAHGRTLYHEVETAFSDALEIERELSEVQQSLASLPHDHPQYPELIEILGELQHRFEEMDAYRIQSKIEEVLMGLGFSTKDLTRQTEEFSGGWQMRIELAKLLLREPSVLLLDEPTNHLDIESQQWLEDHLRSYDGAVVLVSHDRAFLDSLTTRTLALLPGRAEEYTGNYASYVKQRAERREQQKRSIENQQRFIEKETRFIERFRYKASKASQVQSRIKRLEKMEILEDDELEEELRFQFPTPLHSGRNVLELLNMDKSYGDLRLYTGLSCRIERGNHIAVVGVNGAGKSTFARILAGVEPFDRGERVVGHNVSISYYAQHQAEELNPEQTVLQVVDEVAEGQVRTRLRTLLGTFLFHGDDVFKKVSVLSGGEKSRLALAKMLLRPANFLIMDEPTNHLDMRSKAVLQHALRTFDGTFVIVSHDRAFLDPIVNTVMEFTPKGMRSYPGTVTEFLEKKKSERQSENQVRSSEATQENRPHASELRRTNASHNKERSKRVKPLQAKLASLEQTIQALEARKKELEAMMGSEEFYRREDIRERTEEYRTVGQSLGSAYEEWDAISKRIGEYSGDTES